MEGDDAPDGTENRFGGEASEEGAHDGEAGADDAEGGFEGGPDYEGIVVVWPCGLADDTD